MARDDNIRISSALNGVAGVKVAGPMGCKGGNKLHSYPP